MDPLTVVELWQHPVKSAQGRMVPEIALDERGVVGDRRWAIRDRSTGGVLTARRAPDLLFAIGGRARSPCRRARPRPIPACCRHGSVGTSS